LIEIEIVQPRIHRLVDVDVDVKVDVDVDVEMVDATYVPSDRLGRDARPEQSLSRT
jgi:hypothetical protein